MYQYIGKRKSLSGGVYVRINPHKLLISSAFLHICYSRVGKRNVYPLISKVERQCGGDRMYDKRFGWLGAHRQRQHQLAYYGSHHPVRCHHHREHDFGVIQSGSRFIIRIDLKYRHLVDIKEIHDV